MPRRTQGVSLKREHSGSSTMYQPARSRPRRGPANEDAEPIEDTVTDTDEPESEPQRTDSSLIIHDIERSHVARIAAEEARRAPAPYHGDADDENEGHDGEDDDGEDDVDPVEYPRGTLEGALEDDAPDQLPTPDQHEDSDGSEPSDGDTDTDVSSEGTAQDGHVSRRALAVSPEPRILRGAGDEHALPPHDHEHALPPQSDEHALPPLEDAQLLELYALPIFLFLSVTATITRAPDGALQVQLAYSPDAAAAAFEARAVVLVGQGWAQTAASGVFSVHTGANAGLAYVDVQFEIHQSLEGAVFAVRAQALTQRARAVLMHVEMDGFSASGPGGMTLHMPS